MFGERIPRIPENKLKSALLLYAVDLQPQVFATFNLNKKTSYNVAKKNIEYFSDRFHRIVLGQRYKKPSKQHLRMISILLPEKTKQKGLPHFHCHIKFPNEEMIESFFTHKDNLWQQLFPNGEIYARRYRYGLNKQSFDLYDVFCQADYNLKCFNNKTHQQFIVL